MNIDRNQIINLLLRMDTDLRLRSLLFELHFEEFICPAMIARKPSAAFTTGWITGERDGKSVALKDVRNGLNSVDQKFIEQISSKGWQTGLFEFDGRSFQAMPDSDSWLRAGCERANVKFRDYFANTESKVEHRVMKYLHEIDEAVLTDGFASRAAMNCLMKANLVSNIRDLDAVFHSEDNGLSIVEFKRKYPMRNFRPWRSGKALEPFPMDALNDPEPFTEPRSRPGQHFGLDTKSHGKTVVDAFAAGIRYLYLVLESRVTSPDEFFGTDFQASYRKPLLVAEVTPASFRGIAETKGVHRGKDAPRRAQSGSFNSGRRLQLTVDRAEFRPFDIFSPQNEVESL